MCADASPPVRPSFRDSLANLRKLRSLGDLKRLAVYWSYRPRYKQNCCGHYGAPGC